ncbi:MAG: nucleotide exchange factor GrpE [Campylobacter sp.]|nr:nucleotide exchange factor GrpE [Campylobacter sp.]
MSEKDLKETQNLQENLTDEISSEEKDKKEKQICENDTQTNRVKFDEESYIKQIDALNDENAKLKDTLLREIADFENIKKRLEKDNQTSLAYANERFAKDMLQVADALDAAIALEVSDNELALKIKDGMQKCSDMLHSIFDKYGITVIPNDGKFNPEIHNAISVVKKEGKESGDIVEVYQKGYKYNDRVLRASMVVIAK